MPTSSRAVQQEMEDLGSPIGAFLRQRCVIAAGATLPCDALYAAWLVWCRDQHREQVGTVQTFGRDLRAAIPAIDTTNNRINGVREPFRWNTSEDCR